MSSSRLSLHMFTVNRNRTYIHGIVAGIQMSRPTSISDALLSHEPKLSGRLVAKMACSANRAELKLPMEEWDFHSLVMISRHAGLKCH
ncbi:hypothetical protein CEXT_449681 [Caerostris extrusa]|uniref:Uncharacterized protein n=1 Tax=Caerostris extrusa TaxID=172846 RepID=A0AAV4Y553_CAEEX|nr:hypothetical protein CEXT_449681 [Caerostris extrusa]